jgi:hypothetical protein
MHIGGGVATDQTAREQATGDDEESEAHHGAFPLPLRA